MKNIFLFIVILFLTACGETKQVASKKEEEKKQTALAESLQQKMDAGIDLFAKGSSPASWTLEMDFERIINFRSLDGADYKSTPVAPVENATSKTTAYTTKANKGNMVITLYDEKCSDAISGEKFNKKITVEVDGKRYEGCGQYLADTKLSGKWILDKVGIKTVEAAEFAKGLPELVFDLAGGKISGHDGCNNITGTMEVRGSRIKFSAIGSTKMACPSNKKDNEFVQKISDQVANYYFKDGVLILYLIDDSTIVFKKAS